MSERRALAKIEEQLHRDDPDLARLIAEWPRGRCRRRRRSTVPVLAACIVACSLLVGAGGMLASGPMQGWLVFCGTVGLLTALPVTVRMLRRRAGGPRTQLPGSRVLHQPVPRRGAAHRGGDDQSGEFLIWPSSLWWW